MVSVPDVAGKSGSFAVQMLSAAGINAQIDGDEKRSGHIPEYWPRAPVCLMDTVITIQTAAAAQTDTEPASDSTETTTSGDTADPAASSDGTAGDDSSTGDASEP